MKFNFWSWLGLFSNIFTIAIALAVLILMAVLGRRHRGNRSFALFLFLVFGWIGSGQSTQVLIWLNQGDPTIPLRITAAFFFFQAIALFHFVGRLIELIHPWFYLSVGAGLTIGLVGLIPLCHHRVITNPVLSPTGLLQWDIFPLGYALVGIAFAYLAATPPLLFTHHRQVPHFLIIVGVTIVVVAEIAGLCGSLVALPFPLLALGVSVGTALLGTSMVHFQVFRSLKNMTHELQARQAELEERNRRLEEANVRLRELDEWREKMTHMLIHDLKSPLSVVSVVLSDFRNNLALQPDSTQHQLLQSALIAAHRIQNLVGSMLDVHRLEEDRMPVNPVPFDLTSVIDDCIQTANPLLSLYEITVNVEAPTTAPQVYADLELTARVIGNLLDNAVKFSPSPGTLAIRVRPGLDELQFSISDAGPGIAPAYHQQIFEKFFRITPASEDTRSGAGLGLAFCKLALEAQGGRIWVESDGHNGATFHFTLPIWIEPAEAPNSASRDSEQDV
jgi:signal transduction histidine kinase